MSTTRQNEHAFVSWRWLTPVLLTVLIGIGSWFTSTVLSDVTRLKTEHYSQKAAVDLRIQALESQIAGIRAAQEREHRLLVRIATRMGIEVAE